MHSYRQSPSLGIDITRVPVRLNRFSTAVRACAAGALERLKVARLFVRQCVFLHAWVFLILPYPRDIDTAPGAAAGDADNATSAVHLGGVCFGVSSADSAPADASWKAGGVGFGVSSAYSAPAAAACGESSMYTKASKPIPGRKVKY